MSVASTLVIPELTLPFPNFTHPAVREIDDATVAWLHDFGLLADPKQEQYVRKIGLGRWFPSLLPDGPTERVLLGAQLTAWYTVLDDQVAEKHGMQGDTSQLMRHLVHSEDVARLPDGREETSPLQRAGPPTVKPSGTMAISTVPTLPLPLASRSTSSARLRAVASS